MDQVCNIQQSKVFDIFTVTWWDLQSCNTTLTHTVSYSAQSIVYQFQCTTQLIVVLFTYM